MQLPIISQADVGTQKVKQAGEETEKGAMKTADLHLVQVITAAGHHPSDITDAVWNAGYRKTDFTTEQIIEMAVSQSADILLNRLPADQLPKTLDDLSQYELNTIIDEAKWEGSPAAVAKEILVTGYRKETEK